MRIVISATGRDTESNIDTTFGRAPFFLIVDTKIKEMKVIKNKARDRRNKVGITAAKIVEREGINDVITTDIGPLTFKTFKKSGVKVYKAEGKINDAIHLYEEGKLSEIKKATRPKYGGLNQKIN